MKSIIFKLKLFRNDIQNVYIEIEQMGCNNPTQYEMNLIYNNEDMMVFTCIMNLESEQLFRYRYILKSQNNLLKEENFRRFKKVGDDENLVDEWNKVWNSIQVQFDKNEFFAECETFQIFRNLRSFTSGKSDNVVFQLKQLSDDYQFQEQQEKFTFKNELQELQINKNQQIRLNCVITTITFGQLGKQLVKQLGPKFQFLLEQIEKRLEEKDDLIKQLIEKQTQLLSPQMEQLKEKQSLQEEFEQLQTYSIQKSKEYINEIDQLQNEVEKQKSLVLSYQQLNVKKIDFDFNTIVVEKSQSFDELIELLQKYQNSLDQIDDMIKENDSLLESKEKANEIFKQKNEKLANIAQSCQNQLKDVEKKLNQYEEELRNRKEQKEKYEKITTILRQQIIRELLNHQKFFNKQCKKSEQQLRIANDEYKIKLGQLEKQKQDQAETNKNIQIILGQLNYEKKKLEKEKNDQAKTIKELTAKLAKQQSFNFSIPFWVRLFLVLIFVAVLGILCIVNFEMQEELKRKNSIIKGSIAQRNLDDKNLKNQIIQNKAQQAVIENKEQQNINLNDVISYIVEKVFEQLQKIRKRTSNYYKNFLNQINLVKKYNEDFKIKLKQMDNEKKKLEIEKKVQAETIIEMAKSYCSRCFTKFFFGD